MPTASSLKDLIRIRHANRRYIDSLNGNLGSALGFKRRTGQRNVSSKPAILIFVPRKIDPKWLDRGQAIKKELEGPDGLRCPVDVVEGGKYEDTEIWTYDEFNEQDQLVSWERLRGPHPLSEAQLRLREQLRGWSKKVMPGAQLAGFERDGSGYYGTLGCFARDADGMLGFITNQHVADRRNNTLYFPEHDGVPIGIATKLLEWVPDEKRLKGIVNERRAKFRVDCAFVELSAQIDDADIEPRLPVLDAGGRVKYVELGEPVDLDLNTMGPVGQAVVGVGRTRSFQRGTIAAFGYEYHDVGSTSRYTDYLIIGEDGNEFSDPGDSGKLVVTDDARAQPVALLWGGWREQLRVGRGQENWTYAIDINQVIERLDVEIVKRM